MIIVLAVVACALTVPLFGGRLSRLVEAQVSAGWILALALGLQVLVISVIPDRLDGLHAPLHLLSYALGAAFVVANRRLPGVPIMGAGGGLNLIAIVANGGVMPATEAALRASGRLGVGGGFVNSGLTEHARLWWLGDVFATPAWWPLPNVFSVGDVLLVAGACWALHRLSGSRPPAALQRVLQRLEHLRLVRSQDERADTRRLPRLEAVHNPWDRAD